MSKKTTVATIVSLILLWGLSWPAIKVGLAYSPPLLYAGMRTLGGGLLLLLFALPTWRRLQFRSQWRVYLISSLLNVVLFFGLQTVGLYFLPAGLLAVLVYLQPILVGFLAWLWLGESLSVAKIIGLLLGFLGVATVSFESISGKTSLTGILIAISAAVAWAIGTVYVKRVQGQVDLLWLVGMQFSLGGLVLLGTGLTFESWQQIHWTWTLLASQLYAIVFGVSVSWMMWIRLVHAGEVSRTSSYIFVVPLLSVFLGSLFLHESLSVFLLAGLSLIVAGIYLANRPAKLTPAVSPANPTDSSTQTDSSATM
ncbi:MAG: hypothetical protein A2201_11115 [Alicyclobacillus sp. RIFOXYA1_FULL_53_8]|nr:MAG: hypothetical protein A2201_11115 [Alicyclobacillus sp. RIFOXYA1_FULL_53_8]